MSKFMLDWSARHRPGHPVDVKKRRNRKVVKFPWLWLVVPEYDGICGLHTAVSFEVFRYLAASGAEYRESGQWGSSGPTEILSLKGGCTGSSSVSGFSNPDFMPGLRSRFLHAFFYEGNAAVDKWRKDIGLHIDGVAELPILHYSPWFTDHPLSDSVFKNAVRRLLDVRDLQLRLHWNSCHKQAIFVHCGHLGTCKSGWVYQLEYGYRDDSSSWFISVARQCERENFHDFIVRCNLLLESMVYDLRPFDHAGCCDKTPIGEIHEAGFNGSLEPSAFADYGTYHNDPPKPARPMKRDFRFKAKLDRQSGHDGFAIVVAKAYTAAEAEELVKEGSYRVLKTDDRVRIDYDTIARFGP